VSQYHDYEDPGFHPQPPNSRIKVAIVSRPHVGTEGDRVYRGWGEVAQEAKAMKLTLVLPIVIDNENANRIICEDDVPHITEEALEEWRITREELHECFAEAKELMKEDGMKEEDYAEADIRFDLVSTAGEWGCIGPFITAHDPLLGATIRLVGK